MSVMVRRLSKNIIFDFDDTLIVSRSDRARVLFDALDSFGTPGRVEDLAQFWGQPFRDLIVGLAPSVEDRYEEFLSHYTKVLQANAPTACAGVREVLPRLAQTHRLFVHSASHSLLVRTDLQSLGLLHLFDFVCGSDWQRRPKPDPLSFAMLSELFRAQGTELDGSWYVGDASSDVEIAQAAGLRFVGAAYTPTARSIFRDLGVPDEVIIQHMAELQVIVRAGDNVP